MKLLVFAHTPPPLHGQSAMVATLLEGLRDDPEFEVVHVNARLSADAADIGRWSIAKPFRVLAACFAAWRLRWKHGATVFYYVPAPGKRGALYRDLVVMLLCRPFFPHLVLHWHATGLGSWLANSATALERRLAQRLLGNADLAIALAPELIADAQTLQPRRIVVVPNGVPDPGRKIAAIHTNTTRRFQVLFLGLCTRSKGLFDAIEAIVQANEALGTNAFRLTIAGTFSDAATEREFRERIARLAPEAVTYVGAVSGKEKEQLFAASDVFCLPTWYPHEGQPLVLLEAMAHDLPVVATRWRGIPSSLPPSHSWLVKPAQPAALADALMAARHAGPPNGVVRQHYLAHFTPERHLARMKEALRSVGAR